MRSSAITFRETLVSRIHGVEKQRADAQAKADSGDSTFIRLVRRHDETLGELREKLRLFDAEQADLAERAVSKDTARAAKNAARAAEDFEKALAAAARAAKALKDAAAVLADAQRTEQGYWPHRHVVSAAISSRVLEVMGSAGDVKFPGFGSSGAPAVSLADRFTVQPSDDYLS